MRCFYILHIQPIHVLQVFTSDYLLIFVISSIPHAQNVILDRRLKSEEQTLWVGGSPLIECFVSTENQLELDALWDMLLVKVLQDRGD